MNAETSADTKSPYMWVVFRNESGHTIEVLNPTQRDLQDAIQTGYEIESTQQVWLH